MSTPQELGDPSELLSKPGRATLSPVDTETYPLKLAQLLGVTPSTHGRTALVVAEGESLAIVQRRFDVIHAAPTTAAECLDGSEPAWVIVDEAALSRGAWLGTRDGSDVALVRELLALFDAAKASGGTSIFLPDTLPQESTAWLAQGADLTLPFDEDHPHRAEGARLPDYLVELNELARSRRDR